MPKIKLIVTGQMERLSLHHSLAKEFPTHRSPDEEVIWETPHCLPGATSARIKKSEKIWPPMEKLARTLLAEVKGGKTGIQPDLVLLIDDLELHNLDQQDVVAQELRKTIQWLLTNDKSFSRDAETLRKLLRERCSFHLLKPLPEAYFFGDTVALSTLGVASSQPKRLNEQQKEEYLQNSMQTHPPKLVAGKDLELFETDDPLYLPTCKDTNKKQQSQYPYWREECHPKQYLKFLNPYYEETTHGATAMKNLNWKKLNDKSDHLQSVRALFADLAKWFQVSNPLPGQAAPDYFLDESSNVLRNL